MRDGDAAGEIIAAAEQRGADLIVLGSRGRTGLTRLLLGSVARNVLSGSTASVLVVRDRDGARSSHPGPRPIAIDLGGPAHLGTRRRPTRKQGNDVFKFAWQRASAVPFDCRGGDGKLPATPESEEAQPEAEDRADDRHRHGRESQELTANDDGRAREAGDGVELGQDSGDLATSRSRSIPPPIPVSMPSSTAASGFTPKATP